MASFSDSLKRGEDGIWHLETAQRISYPAEGHDVCFMLEDNSYWFRHRNECIVAAIKNFPPHNNIIFDIGGGNGYVSLGLENAGFKPALLEPGIQGAQHAAKRGLKTVICGTLESACFQPHSLPAAGLFDVIEHIENDQSFLRSLHTVLMPGGMLYLTVPASPFLWSQEDEQAGHFRRYTIASVCRLLKSTGFSIQYATHFFRFLTIPIFLSRSLPHKLKLTSPEKKTDHARDHLPPSKTVSTIITSLLHPEIAAIKKKKTMQFGSSCLIVAKSL